MSAATNTRSAGRLSHNTSVSASDSPTLSTTNRNNPFPPPASTSSFSDESRTGAKPSHRAAMYSSSSKRPPRLDIETSSYTPTEPPPPPVKMATNRAKLHRKVGSASSMTRSPSPSMISPSGFTTPFAAYEDPLLQLSDTPHQTTSTPKIKPYLRRMSGNTKDNQGQIDLSKPSAENERLAGLGINGYISTSPSIADVTFSRAECRQQHARTTSVGSNVSAGSGSFKAVQPFVHPLKMTPRPFTPPLGHSPAASTHDEDHDEKDDIVVEPEIKLGPGMRSRRSISISNQPVQPTPLSQSHTVDELEPIPKLTSPSLTNLSIKSNRSGKSSKTKFGRPRRSTNASFDNATSPSSRTSFDKAFSLVSKRSDTEPLSRDERIRAARRKFEEKEADKDRKMSKEARKRQDSLAQREAKREARDRRKSEASSLSGPKANSAGSGSGSGSGSGGGKRGRKDSALDGEAPGARPYADYRPAHEASLPVYGKEAGYSEKVRPGIPERNRQKQSQTGWLRFSTWMQTRMLSCGDTR